MPSRKPNIKARNHNLQLKELQDTFENNAMDVYSNAKRHQIPKALSIICFYHKFIVNNNVVITPKWFTEQLKLRGLYLTIDKPAWIAVLPEKAFVPTKELSRTFSQECCILDFRLNSLNLSETQRQLFDCWRQLCTVDNVLYETFIYGWETRIKNQKERPVKGFFFY